MWLSPTAISFPVYLIRFLLACIYWHINIVKKKKREAESKTAKEVIHNTKQQQQQQKL